MLYFGNDTANPSERRKVVFRSYMFFLVLLFVEGLIFFWFFRNPHILTSSSFYGFFALAMTQLLTAAALYCLSTTLAAFHLGGLSSKSVSNMAQTAKYLTWVFVAFALGCFTYGIFASARE